MWISLDGPIANVFGYLLPTYPLLIGTAFTVQESAALPAEDHDVPLDMILTEQGLRSLSQSL